MLISPINLRFTSEGFLCARHQRCWSCLVSSGECKQSFGYRQLFPHRSLIFPFITSLVYVGMGKGRKKTKSLSLAFSITCQKDRQFNLILASVTWGHRPHFLPNYTFTPPSVTTSFSYDTVNIIGVFHGWRRSPGSDKKHPFSSKESNKAAQGGRL